MSEDKTGFLHISGDKSFQSRAKSVFEGLDVLEPKKESEEQQSREILRAKRRKPNQVPDHVLHPEKWTKYSLEEDGSEKLGGMSANEVNKHAAFSFLKELKDRKSGTSVDSRHHKNTEASKDARHSFSKPVNEKDSFAAGQRIHVARKEGALVMPEYVVGKSKPNSKRKRSENISSSSTKHGEDVQIGHLVQAEEEDNQNENNQEKDNIKNNKGNPSTERIQFSRRKHRDNKNIRKHTTDDDDDVN